jgi:hypothetical protein
MRFDFPFVRLCDSDTPKSTEEQIIYTAEPIESDIQASHKTTEISPETIGTKTNASSYFSTLNLCFIINYGRGHLSRCQNGFIKWVNVSCSKCWYKIFTGHCSWVWSSGQLSYLILWPVAFFLIVLLSEVWKRKQRESLKGMQGLKKYFNI